MGTELIFKGGPSIKGGALSLKSSSTLLGRFAKAGFEEGVEEILAEVFQPIAQNFIQHGDLSKIDENGDWLKNILIAGTIGSIIGMFGEGLNLASVDLSKIGFLKPGAKVTRAQVLGAIELAQNNKVLFDNKLNSEIKNFADKYGFNDSDIKKFEKSGKKLLTEEQLKEYNDAVAKDKETQSKYEAFMFSMSKIFTAVGKDAFSEAFNL
jgi:hypothetical protein